MVKDDPKSSSCVHDELNIVGEWWLPERPDKKSRGSLTGSISTEFNLAVESILEELSTPKNSGIVLGRTRDGKDVTLGQCWVRRTNFKNATYHVHWVLIGGHFSAFDTWKFSGLRFGIHLLDQWHNPTCFSSLEPVKEGKYTFTYSPPQRTLIAETPSVRVYLDYEIGPVTYTRGQTEFTLRHDPRIELEAKNTALPLIQCENYPSDQVLSSIGHWMCAFFSLATSTEVFPYDLRASLANGESSDGKTKSRAYPIQVYRITEITAKLVTKSDFEMEINWLHVQDNPCKYFGAWLSKISKIGMPIWLYLDAVCQKHRYVEDPYISLVQALEGYHRYAYPNESLPTDEHQAKLEAIYQTAPPESLSWLKEKLRYSHEPSLAKRLKDLLRNQKECTTWLLGAWKNAETWIQDIKNTRNAHAHCLGDEIAAAYSVNPRKRYRERVLMQAIMLRYLLSELEFDDERAMGVIKYNRSFSSLAAQAANGFADRDDGWE